jgi:pimeloyl-ACP methyl ester carboxylesterase
MPRVPANGIEIEYELIDNPSASPLLLISGHGSQLVSWDDDFCGRLADRGFLVIRYDNRDSGLSTKIEGGPDPDPLAAAAGDYSSASYTLADLADDAAGLLNTVGIDAAHIVGSSMGGMVAQWFAFRHPHKTLSLTSIMSMTGNRDVGLPSPEGLEAIMKPPAETIEESIELTVETARALASPGYPFDESRVRARETRAHHRGWYPEGAARQLVAILASGDWTESLHSITVPTLVIHGDADQTVNVDGGQATAAAIPGAELMIIPGMSHDIPEPVWDAVFEAITRNATRSATPAARQ